MLDSSENSSSNNNDLTWDNMGDELLYFKDKFNFTSKEKKTIKKLIKKAPPPLKYRRKVTEIYIIVYKFISCG